MQKTEYSFFVVFIDDASIDSTPSILRDYANKYPELFKVMLSKKNRFKRNELWEVINIVHEMLSGYVKYFATCEGDDYWTDSNKIQIQTSYMNEHFDCMMYLHNSWVIDCRTGDMHKANPFVVEGERDLHTRELLEIRNGHPATASRFYRKELVEVPEFVLAASVGDYNLMTYASIVGEVHYSDRIMCAYRFMSKNSTTEILNNKDELGYLRYHHLGLLIYLFNFDHYTGYKYNSHINRIEESFLLGAAESETLNNWLKKSFSEMLQPYVIKNGIHFYDLIRNKIRQLYDETYISPELHSFVRRYDEIIVFGTGVYSEVLTRQLSNNGIPITGYVRSSVSSDDEMFMGKLVMKPQDICNNNHKSGVIISIIPKIDDGIDDTILKNGITDYFYAFGFNIEEIDLLCENNEDGEEL